MAREEGGIKKQDYVNCPVCGWNRTIEKWRTRKIRSNPFSKDKVFIRVAQIIGGKSGEGLPYKKRPGGGIITLEDECMTLREAWENPMFRDTVEDLKRHIMNVIKIMLDDGILTEDELSELLG